LVVESTEEVLLLKVIPKLEEMAGAYAKLGKVGEIKREIEKLRGEYEIEGGLGH